MPSPVLILGFKRPQRMLEILDVLCQSGFNDVYVSLDAPRTGNQSDAAGSEKVFALVNSYSDRLRLTINRFSSNQGAGKGVFGGITWFFSKVSSGIIIEDDCIPIPAFLEFSSRALEYYDARKEVGMISGCQFAQIPPDTHALVRHQVPITWGWATWKDRWDGFNLNIAHLSSWNRFQLARKQALKFRHCVFYTLALKLADQAKMDAWDLQWSLYNWTENRFSLASPITLITYKGVDENATHSSKEDHANGVRSRQINSLQIAYGHEIFSEEYDWQTADFIHSSSSSVKLMRMFFSIFVPRTLFKSIRRRLR